MHGDLIMSNPNRIQKANKQVAIEKRTKELTDYIEKDVKTISKTILDMWKAFEENCLVMSDHYPSYSPDDIENLSAWKFYKLYSYISKKNKPRQSNGTKEIE